MEIRNLIRYACAMSEVFNGGRMDETNQKESAAVNEVPVLNGNIVDESVESFGTVNGAEDQTEEELGEAFKSVSKKSTDIHVFGKLEVDKDVSVEDASECLSASEPEVRSNREDSADNLFEKEKLESKNDTSSDASFEVEMCSSGHQAEELNTAENGLSESQFEKFEEKTSTGENEAIIKPVNELSDEAEEERSNEDNKNSENADIVEMIDTNEITHDDCIKQKDVIVLSASDAGTKIERQDSKDVTCEKMSQEINGDRENSHKVCSINESILGDNAKLTVDVGPVENVSLDSDRKELKEDEYQNMSQNLTDSSKDEVLETEGHVRTVVENPQVSGINLDGNDDFQENVSSDKFKTCENEDSKTSLPETTHKTSLAMESCSQQTRQESDSTMVTDITECNSLNTPQDKTASTAEKNSKIALKNSSSKLKSKTLDEVLFKITTLAENENQQKAASQVSEPSALPKKPKARKSCAPVKQPSGSAKKPITSLTFNVKELEKQGLLDIPKAQKRKAFEPMKIKTERSNYEEHFASDCGAKYVSVKSPVKSPGTSDIPFSKKSKLIRKKKGRRGAYKLPGEKSKRKQKKSETHERMQENSPGHCEKASSLHSTQKSSSETSPVCAIGRTPKVEQCSNQKNVLSVTKTNRSLLAQTPSSSLKKARKSVKSADSFRTIDSFFIGGNNSSQPSSKPLSPNSAASKESSLGSKDSEARKRKAQGIIPNSTSPSLTPEEKKRKTEGTEQMTKKIEDNKSPPPQMITLLPTAGPPLSVSKLHPTIIQSTPSGSSNSILVAQGNGSGAQTIIQNGTLNGLPMFQIVNGPNGATQKPQQLVTISASQGQSLIQSNFPRTSTLLQANRMPLILAPVSVHTVVNSQVSSPSQVTMTPAVISPSNVLTTVSSTSLLGTRLVPVSNLSGHKLSETGVPVSSDFGSFTPQTKLLISNGQLVDTKHVSRNGSLPNGLYPVTPPKTPETNSLQDTKDNVELSPGGTPLPDKDIIPLCTCKINGANFQKLASLVTYCQALDSVDSKVMGCCNKVTGTQVVRPAVKVPFLSLCEAHRKRLRAHQCCPGCGHFCTQGKFLQCKKEGGNSLHLFHEQCLVIKDGKNFCPHCGETSAHVEVHLSLQESKPSIMKETKSSRVQLKARISAKTASAAEEPVEDPGASFTIEKTKKTISTSNLPFGPDRHSLEKTLACLGQERPKKFRHLPKCLYTPAYDQDLERTLYMLEDGHDPNEKFEDLESQSALHAAATVGSLALVHLLIQAGASPHLQDKTLKTPLMYAAENNHLDVVKYLVKAGSILDSKADDGMTALHYAAKAGHVEVLRILLDSEKIKVDVTDDGGWTPLIWAVEHDQIEAVKLLLKRNADPNLRDSEENTTLHWAAFSGSEVIAEMLLTAGCDLDSLNMHGDRPLHIAARQDHYECVVLFLARGADVEAKNNKGEIPEECCQDSTTTVSLALQVNRKLKKFGAKHMGRPERLVHRDLSKGRENIPIPCVNAVDDDGMPQDYLYVTDNIETTSLNVNRVIGSLQSCQCKDDCSSIYCACGKNSVRCWYDKFGRLIPEFNMVEPPLIFECNRACTCWTTCNNRVVQNGVMSRLQVFKTDGRGWGCKTLVDIQRGTFICEYIGEHISDSEADSREDDSYLFDLDNRDGETYCIDARKYGNIARFINHLCEPNLVPVKVFVDSQDLRFPRICLFASRDILAGEELGFDYGEKFWIIKYKHFTCTCGSPKCRYSKDTIQKTLEEYHLRHDDEEAEVVKEGQT